MHKMHDDKLACGATCLHFFSNLLYSAYEAWRGPVPQPENEKGRTEFYMIVGFYDYIDINTMLKNKQFVK